jgi:hypothetical protein
MGKLVMLVIFAVAFPWAVLTGGGLLMNAVSNRAHVTRVLEQAAEEDRQPLNLRWRGYSVADADRHWREIKSDADATQAEKRFLELDLVYPFFYGAALATGLLVVWTLLGRPVSAVWVIGPVAGGMMADWIENLIHLRQLERYVPGDAGSLHQTAIAVASIATSAKWLFLTLAAAALLAGAGAALLRGVR